MSAIENDLATVDDFNILKEKVKVMEVEKSTMTRI